ncbi:MAG: fibrobacter succinogenes major paralogous domain-containing protein [Fibromonadaceae bacterium]|jgi:uncharacterized protein (TIGR02145 family)|nr:fibrobacter succinogenes major paralogous domain-containing protein [Fibromonadaceae bacterium]
MNKVKPTLLAAIFIAMVFTISCSSGNRGTFKDGRDGKTYKWVKIGTQVWMAENLNFKTGNSLCSENDESNCQKYGRLYDWETAMKTCPDGWHLPSHAEWEILVKQADPNATGDWDNIAGTKLKATTGWIDEDTEFVSGTDDLGFSALPGGRGYPSGISSVGFFGGGGGGSGYWWSATEFNASSAWARSMNRNVGVERGSNYKSGLFSVRCLKD